MYFAVLRMPVYIFTIVLCTGGLCELGGGQHVYDFSVLIPANSPSSFEGFRKFGYVRYMIHAAIENKYGYTTMAKDPLPFTVVHQLDLNDEHSSVAVSTISHLKLNHMNIRGQKDTNPNKWS